MWPSPGGYACPAGGPGDRVAVLLGRDSDPREEPGLLLCSGTEDCWEHPRVSVPWCLYTHYTHWYPQAAVMTIMAQAGPDSQGLGPLG